MSITNKLVHFKTKQKFNEELTNRNILETSIVFILDTKEIYTHGLFYDGSKVDLSNIEASILNILDNYATKDALQSKAEDSAVVHKSETETITGVKTFNGRVNFLGNGDDNSVYLSTNTRINVNGTTNTVLGFGSGNFYINHGNYNLLVRGKATRPTYNGSDMALLSDVNTKQNTLISGTNIKTINGESILGEGNIVVEGGEQDLSEYAKKSEIPTKVSQLENDSGFFTTEDTDGSIEDVGDNITLEQLNTALLGKQDKLVSGSNIKTINGTSILGSGNIVIEGGSSSGGSGAYTEINHGTSDTTFTLTPNTFHVWDEVASLDLSFADETTGVANEYLFQFTSGATATTLTLPDGLKWANDSALTIAENMIYQISVLKGLASVLEFNKVLLISFNVYHTGKKAEYTAKEGMTWEQWVDSSYNFEGAIVTADGKILFSSYLVNDVTKDDEIISNYVYNTSYYG